MPSPSGDELRGCGIDHLVFRRGGGVVTNKVRYTRFLYVTYIESISPLFICINNRKYMLNVLKRTFKKILGERVEEEMPRTSLSECLNYTNTLCKLNNFVIPSHNDHSIPVLDNMFTYNINIGFYEEVSNYSMSI